jgi:hypothetical protein
MDAFTEKYQWEANVWLVDGALPQIQSSGYWLTQSIKL